ncbi:hypothetical protein LUZ60_004921 [Juncus effusus]|nr:hypothetical protein LUZ60_004921 [Juncus effusus]
MDRAFNPQSSDCLCCSHANSTVQNPPTIPNNSTNFAPHDLKFKLLELESLMLSDEISTDDTSESQVTLENFDNKWHEMADLISKGNLKQTLISCARAISDGDDSLASWLMTELRNMVSVHGEPIQRLGAYILEGLVARFAKSGSSICKSLTCKEPPPGSELLSYMRIIYELCPYIKFGYLCANNTILDAMQGENHIHIIDFQIAQGTQWIGLIQSLATQSAAKSDRPTLRITGIDDPANKYARGGDLSIVASRLAKIAELNSVPFEFNSVERPASQIQIQDLNVRPGESIAVNFILKLHHIPDESVNVTNHRDRILRLVKSINPKVVTIVEQESNTNTAPFFHRVGETLDYYNAIFESIDVTLPRDDKDRTRVEQHCLAKEIVNIIACEGEEREERHELFGKWKSRLSMAGFSMCELSPTLRESLWSLLVKYDKRYRCQKRDEAVYLGWCNRDLVVFSAWK